MSATSTKPVTRRLHFGEGIEAGEEARPVDLVIRAGTAKPLARCHGEQQDTQANADVACNGGRLAFLALVDRDQEDDHLHRENPRDPSQQEGGRIGARPFRHEHHNDRSDRERTLSAMPSAIGPDAEIASSTVSTPCCPSCVGLLRQIAAIDGLMAAGHEG